MRGNRRLTLLAAIACLALLLTTGAAPAGKERFTCIVDEEGGPPQRVTISVHNWTTDQESAAPTVTSSVTGGQ